jgi:membrane-associated protease RseP (regulator of RpoE activity)
VIVVPAELAWTWFDLAGSRPDLGVTSSYPLPRMKRMPLWPIAFGLTVWGAAIYVAVVGPWWPLAIVAAVSLLPGLVIGVVTLLGRGAKKNAQAMLDARADAPARPEATGPIAEPPVVRESRARTNAKNAGRRKGGKVGAVLVLLASAELQGCEKIERARAERRARESAEDGGAAADTAATAQGATPTDAASHAAASKIPATVAGADAALEAALARAITPPDGNEATWRVDPFVAALLVEQLRRGVGPSFTALGAPIPEGPRVGFRVGEVPEGSMLHRLGLRTGDVIETVGGVELSDASRLGFALDGAQNKVDVMVFRDGISTVHSYRMTDGIAWRGLLADFPPGTAAVASAPEVAVNDVPPSGGASAPRVGDDDGGGTPAGGSPAGGGAKPSGGGGTPSVGPGGASGGGKVPSGGGPSGGPSASDPVRCESSGKCTVVRAYFDKMVASPSSVQSQANIVPAIANDVHSGYKLKSVKAGSAIAKLGFRAGDKITHVNGVDLTDELAALGLLGDLSSKSLFRIRYERNGSAATKTVVVE